MKSYTKREPADRGGLERPAAAQDRSALGGLPEILNQSPKVQAQLKLDRSLNQRNETGMPDGLKSGIEEMSGLSLDGVKVHYNSPKPAQLNALAYAQGTDIHVAPGQEQHLPHEAWHVVQQAQGRVRPTMQTQGIDVNDDPGLEREADGMGLKALRLGEARRTESVSVEPDRGTGSPTVQMAYGPNSLTTSLDDSQTITDLDIHRPGTRPNVPESVSSTGSPGDVYRHFTNWATMRDALAEKYIGLPLEEATLRSRAAQGFGGQDHDPADPDRFMDLLKQEMNRASQAGAMGNLDENESRNQRERSAEADAKKSPANRALFQSWIASQLDVRFVPGRTPDFNVTAAKNHILHTLRAIRYRARPRGIPRYDKAAAKYGALAQNQTVEDVILGTAGAFGPGEIVPESLFSYLGGQGVKIDKPLADQDLWELEDALNKYTPDLQEEYKRLTFVAPSGDRLTIAADLASFPDEDAEEQYYDMMADLEMKRLIDGDSGSDSDSD